MESLVKGFAALYGLLAVGFIASIALGSTLIFAIFLVLFFLLLIPSTYVVYKTKLVQS